MTNAKHIARITIDEDKRDGDWAKRVTAVDKTKKNGYAFEGEFLDNGEHDLPVGAIVIAKRRRGSRRRPIWTGQCYSVQADGTLAEIGESHDWRTEFLTFRDLVAERVRDAEAIESPSPLAGYSDADLISELEARGYVMPRPQA